MGNYYQPFSLRIPDELMEKVKYIAQQSKRSTNKEMEYALEAYVASYENQNGRIDTEPVQKQKAVE